MAFFINEKCTKCAACLSECPTLSIVEGRTRYVIDTDLCDNHQACVAVCPVNAIVKFTGATKEVSAPSASKAPSTGKPTPVKK